MKIYQIRQFYLKKNIYKKCFSGDNACIIGLSNYSTDCLLSK